MNESDEDIIKDIEQQIAEGRELEGAEPVKVTVSPNLTVTYALRLTPEEYETYAAAAKARGMKMSDFTRAALRAAVAGEADLDQAAKWDEMRRLINRMMHVAAALPEEPTRKSSKLTARP